MVFRKGNRVMKRDGKTSSSKIIPFVGPQREAQLRHEEAGRIWWTPRLPDKRKEGWRKGEQWGRTRGHVFLGIEIFSNELFFKSFQGGSITRGNPGEVLNYKHQPTQRARTSFTARCITDGQGAPVRRMWEIDTTALRNRQCSIWTLQLQRNIWILDNLVGPPKEEAFIRMKRHLDVTTNILQLRTYFEPQYLWNIVSQKQKYKVSQEGIKVVQPMT